ncbi:integral membrane protein [Aspergillus ellipticus CBS 707.79]|uniref:Integral membrane protein n=1 Tax=Aspergillus ellipticus CBS 707.79 TaxID=1448320 RepID=A0A319EG74_9EURO|nr:integral membrane protein [Aspergillus ellipticus CBS 707.79]
MPPSQDTLSTLVSDKAFHHEENETGDLPSTSVTLTRHRRKLQVINPPWYRNSLLASVGFLEVANAGDFAANVWNDVPIPLYAKIFMAIGGPLALLISIAALRDGILSWQNVRILQEERQYLALLRMQHLNPPAGTPIDQAAVRLIDRRLGVGYRELGSELIDRIVMDAFLGVGALLVGTGTIMAIWGANPYIYFISNLLSGFVGNAFAAAYGVLNAIWSVYLMWRFDGHDKACMNASSLAPFRDRLHRRFQYFKWHALVSAITGLVAGAASMITCRMWWGYVVLIPCMLSEVGCNQFWRILLGYDRPIVSDQPHWGLIPDYKENKEDEEKDGVLLDTLASVISMQNAFKPHPSHVIDVDWSSLDSLLLFIANNHLFDSLCGWLAADSSVPKDLRHYIFRLSTEYTEITLTLADLRGLPEAESPRLHDLCRNFLYTEGRQVMLGRERFLLEMVGYAAWKDG